MADKQTQSDRIKHLEGRIAAMTEWAKEVNARLDALEGGKPAAANSRERKWPEAIDVELSPVPADYDGLFAVHGWNKDNDEPMIWAPNALLDSPCHTAEDGGDDYIIVPVLSKANKAGWMGVLAEAAEADSPERKNILNEFEGHVNEGLECSPMSFGFLRSVRGKNTEIDIEAWAERRAQIESVEAEAYEQHQAASAEDPF